MLRSPVHALRLLSLILPLLMGITLGVPIASAHAGGDTVLPVPYWNQYHVYSQGSDDCGPTSVAMVADYYGLWPSGTSVGDFTKQIRGYAGETGNTLTDAYGLEQAAAPLGMSYTDMGTMDAYSAIMTMANAVANGNPVVALIDASVMGRWYTLHWVVVTGFSADGNYVYLNDPDQNPYGGAYSGGQIEVSLDTFYAAVQSAADSGNDLGFVLYQGPGNSGGTGNNGNPGNGGEPCGIVACDPTVLGGLDLYSYCLSLGYSNASLDGTTAYDWHCDDSWGYLYGIDMNAACQWQYPGASAYAIMGDMNNPDSWVCYGYPVAVGAVGPSPAVRDGRALGATVLKRLHRIRKYAGLLRSSRSRTAVRTL